jgi:CHAT domain-containing protein/tetratricopeptide (TPR) repeat protein
MKNRAYYLLVWVGLALALPCAPVDAQSPGVPPSTLIETDCALLSADAIAAMPDSGGSVKRLEACGKQFSDGNDLPASRRIFEGAVAMARRRGDATSLASVLYSYGDVLIAIGEGGRAEPALVESGRIDEELGDRKGMAEAANALGRLRNMQARYEEARVYHLRSFELWSEIDDQLGIAIALNNVGHMYLAVSDYTTALDYYQRSLDGLERLGDRRRSATVLDNMGVIARRLGDYGRGLDLAQKALAIRESFQDRVGIAKSFDSLSEVYQAQGNYGAALEVLGKSLDLRRAIGRVHATAEALNNIAVVYEAQGSYETAVKYLRQSLALNDAKVGSQSLVAEIHTHLGELFLRQGQLTRATQSLKRSLAISEASDYKLQAADARYVLGRVYIARRQFSAAQSVLEDCLTFRDATGDRRGRADVLIEMAELDRRRGRLQNGLDRATEAGHLAEVMELPDAQRRALTLVGRLQLARSRREDARDAFDGAIALIEGMRSRNPGREEARSRFFSDRLAPYQERIAMALAASNVAEALSFAERSKARALLDVIRGDGILVTKAMTVEERTRELELRTSLSSVNSELATAVQAVSANEARVSALKRTRDAKRLDYEEFQSRLYAAHPELRASRAAAPTIGAAEAQRLLSGPESAIVEFVAGRDRTIAFVVTRSGLSAFTLNVTTTELGRQVQRFRDQLANRDLRAVDAARALYDLILGPMHAAIRDTTNLIIVPDGVLWNLPFQALQSSARRYVVEDTAISYAPSITVLREMMQLRRATRAPRTLLALGNPAAGSAQELPDSEYEVRQVAQIYGASSRVYVGAEAREDRWKTEAPDYRVLHLATHGVLDNTSPLYSHLLLAPPDNGSKGDGLLEAWEIMNVPLRADLVVLSACETARGRVAAGEGLLGLMWAVFVAGSPATLVSQWRVDSKSSAALMIAFHQQWNAGGGISKARALQQASIAVLRTRGFSHPFYWAGFILAGDGR